MTAQEVLKAGIEEEVQEDIARITQHHDEGHQSPNGAIDRDPPKMPPVSLGLFTGRVRSRKWDSAFGRGR